MKLRPRLHSRPSAGLSSPTFLAQGLQSAIYNNLNLSLVEPFASLDGVVGKYFHYDAGFRQELVWTNNQDVINPPNSFDKLAALTLPKATIVFVPPDHPYSASVAFSYGEAFHTEDPRIGTGTAMSALLAPSWAYQLRVSKIVRQFQFNVTLKQVAIPRNWPRLIPIRACRRTSVLPATA
jgi:hypothetical protein